MTRPLSRRERATTDRVTVDLMHLASGRPDLSSSPCDHDDWCARTEDAAALCTCSRSHLFRDGR